MKLASPASYSSSSSNNYRYNVYSKRFLMMGLFSLLSFSNAICWITYAPIADLCAAYYDTDLIAINYLSMIWMIMYILVGFQSANITERKSLRTSLLIGASLNVFGAFVRILPYPFISTTSSTPGYIFAFVGMFILALAQTFILATPSIVAQYWFPPSERVTATSIGALFNQAGIAVGFFIPSMIVRDDPTNLPYLMMCECVICIVALIGIFFFFKSHPPTAPSPSANRVKLAYTNKEIIVRLFRNRNYILLLLLFGINVGIFYTLSTLLGQICNDLSYSSDTAGRLGVILVIVGLIGAIIAGTLADKYNGFHYHILIAVLICTFISMVWFSSILSPNNEVMLSIVCAFLGFFLTAILPISLDLAVETTYPHPESVTTMIIMMSAQFFGILFINILSVVHTNEKSVHYASWSLTAVSFISVLFGLGFKARYGRLEAEEEIDDDNDNDNNRQGERT